MEDQLKFKNENPGSVKHGNFINYYQFHPPEERISLLPKDIWTNFDHNRLVALDVGCNAGDLTTALYEFLGETTNRSCSILGIDIDPVLIERATEKIASRNIEFACMDFTDTERRKQLLSEYLFRKEKNKFDVLFCFSTTMWIHLNNGDEGLVRFLEDLCEVCETLVIEPQPWKCYKSALKRVKNDRNVFPEFSNLKIREKVEEQIETLLKGRMKKVVECEKSGWDRKILIFSSK